MSQATVASYTDKTSDILRYFATKVSLNSESSLDYTKHTAQLFGSEIVRFLAGIEFCLGNDGFGSRRTYTVNIPERVFNSLLSRYVYT